jgi:hypothetical protein
MALGQRDVHAERRASALKEAVNPVAVELRLIEVADLITFIHSQQFANIQDIVNSSVELFFKPGSLSFGWVADFEIDWDRTPTIILGMEFRRHEIWVVFKLMLRAFETRIAIDFLSFEKSSGNPEQDTARLIEVIADARLPARRR